LKTWTPDGLLRSAGWIITTAMPFGWKNALLVATAEEQPYLPAEAECGEKPEVTGFRMNFAKSVRSHPRHLRSAKRHGVTSAPARWTMK
jgi:hypothetical protein